MDMHTLHICTGRRGPLATVSTHRIAVNGPLTASRRRRRRRRYTETRDFGAMVSRMIRAYAARVANADMEDLTQLVAMQAQVDEAISTAVEHLREHHGFSWSSIGEATGLTRQGAQQRYGRRGGAA